MAKGVFVAKMRTIFLRGLMTLLPIAVTIYILYTGVVIFEDILGGLIRSLLPEHTYIPGLGFAFTILLIFLFGLLLNNLISQTLLQKLEEGLKSIPLIKAVYSPLQDLINLFSNNKGMRSVVLVKWQEDGPYTVGLITRETFDEFPSLQNEGLVAVFIPFSYALGGQTLLFKKKNLQPIDIPVEKALQLSITAWVKGEQSDPASLNKRGSSK